MKKSEIRQIIREEILKEKKDTVQSYIEKFKKEMRGCSNRVATDWVYNTNLSFQEKLELLTSILGYIKH